MNTLWFVKFEHRVECQQVVFLFTLPVGSTSEEAVEKGRGFISEFCRPDYVRPSAEAVCQTSDVVEYFEPV